MKIPNCLVLTLVFAGTANAASFDCSKAKKAVEVAICANEKLSAADERLTAAYKSALAANQKEWKTDLVKTQRKWLAYLSDGYEKQIKKPNQRQTPRDWLSEAIAAQIVWLQEAAERERIVQLEQASVAKEVCSLVLDKENMSLKRDDENDLYHYKIQATRVLSEPIWEEQSYNVYQANFDVLNNGSSSVVYRIDIEYPRFYCTWYIWVAPGEEAMLAKRLAKGANSDVAQELGKELTVELPDGVAPGPFPTANPATLKRQKSKFSSRLLDTSATNLNRGGYTRPTLGMYKGITYVVSGSGDDRRGGLFAVFRPQAPGLLIPLCYFRALPSVKTDGEVVLPDGYAYE